MRLRQLFLPLALVAPLPALADAGDLGPYMRARVADGDGHVDAAARDYALALQEDPANPVVAVRAYREAVQAGDYALADGAAAALDRAGVAPADAALLAVARAAAAHDMAAAKQAIARLSDGQLTILRPSLSAWVALEEHGDPLAALGAPPRDAVARRFNQETRALILIAQGKTADGLAALRAVLGNDQASVDNRIAAARLLLGRRRADDARALLVGDPPAVAALRAHLDRPGDRIPAKPSLAFGASQLFTRIASDLALGTPGPLSFALTQAALRADPTNDRAHLLLAGALSREGATDRAIAVLAEVPADSPYAPGAAAGRVQILAAADRDEEALKVARGALGEGGVDRAASPDLERLADLYLQLERPAEAVPLYRQLVGRDDAPAWPRWLQLGAAYDQSGDWPRARDALDRAIALAPDEPLVLNYLGYALIERRERMNDAQKMLEKAARLRPDDAAITDSLGWSLYLRGDVARALPLIERAAKAEPANGEITEHLGDVYWQTGRRYEARYAWAAARVVTAEPKMLARLSGKIADGLDRK